MTQPLSIEQVSDYISGHHPRATKYVASKRLSQGYLR